MEQKLYSINFTYHERGEGESDSEPEWMYTVGQYPTDRDARRLAKQHIIDNCGIEKEDIILDECWVNEVEVEGYEIKLTKVEV